MASPSSSSPRNDNLPIDLQPSRPPDPSSPHACAQDEITPAPFLPQQENARPVIPRPPPFRQNPTQTTAKASTSSLSHEPSLIQNDNLNDESTANKNPHDELNIHTSRTSDNFDAPKKRRPSQPAPYYYPSFSQNRAAGFLKQAALSGKLGSGEVESPSHLPILRTLLQTIPYQLIFVQGVWSAFVTIMTYVFADKSVSSFSFNFWTSRFNLSDSVSYGLGWALFVLLGFFVREASQRYTTSLATWARVSERLLEAVRHIVQVYPSSTWHPGDTDRIIAHLVAYPIALKMMLRGEREREQIAPFLHPDDVEDVVSSDSMHVHCLRVVRAYMAAAEDDAPYGFIPRAQVTPAGWGTRFFIVDIIDSVDQNANGAIRIANFRPSIGYVNHLHVFYFIWMAFLPLAIVKTSGWFTTFWSILISYGVGMMLVIAKALNEPFGFDVQDVKLNRLASTTALHLLNAYFNPRLTLDAVIDQSHQTPYWLEFPAPRPPPRNSFSAQRPSQKSFKKIRFDKMIEGTFKMTKDIYTIFKELCARLTIHSVRWPLLAFITWLFIIVFVSWALARRAVNPPPEDVKENCRWWCIYVPIDSSTTSYVSLGLFLLLGFWLNDAYERYWSALMLWQTTIRSGIDEVVFQFAIICERGMWHHRDRERLFSYLAALPFVAKSVLRSSRDTSELRDILSPNDLAALEASDSMRHHCFDVIYGYCNSVDSIFAKNLRPSDSSFDDDENNEKRTTLGITAYSTLYNLWAVEKAFQECETIHNFPISKSFTAHMGVFTALWLAILPLSTILHDGFLSFLYMTPIGYSIINLVVVGKELSDPFGYDKHDLPLDILCTEIRDSIHNIYQSSLIGPEGFIHPSKYSRHDFTPEHNRFRPGLHLRKNQSDANEDEIEQPTFGHSKDESLPDRRSRKPSLSEDHNETIESDHQLAKDVGVRENVEDPPREGSLFKALARKFVENLPSVSPVAMLTATVWTVLAVTLSYVLSFTWDEERRNKCGQWCSPIDVDGSILENAGFALFMILSFRASDAMNRYEEGAMLLYDMEMNLRNLAVEIVQSFNDGTCHENDKERVVAHIVQVPLCFRDLLLDIERNSPDEKEGFLSDEDRATFERSPDPIEYLLQTVDAYILKMDSLSQSDSNNLSDGSPGSLTYFILDRVSKIRLTIAHALAVKRFPVVGSYTKHQHLFMALWLGLLPLGMTPQAGWFTILWAPVISYGIFGLEAIAAKLVDPYGLDDIDIPVESICLSSADLIIRAVHFTGWDCTGNVVQSSRKQDASVPPGDNEGGPRVASFDTFDINGPPSPFGEGELQRQDLPVKAKIQPTLYLHFLRSTPWGALLSVLLWTCISVGISYVTRKADGRARWWESQVSIDSSVSTYVSFAAFTLLGFYVEASFTRYNEAGIMLTDSLRSSCHALATQWFTMFEQGTWHNQDHARVIGHIAALPLVVKNELRGIRDMTELKGLLSFEDVEKIRRAHVMSSHCLDVIRSYFITGTRHTNRLNKNVYGGHRLSFVQLEIRRTEGTIRSAMFLKKYAIAPGFIVLLNVLVGTWFFLLPFVLAEKTGWFTILWIPMIAYGVLGVYSLATELQQPFGYDVNDLDLDVMANEIVEDVLFVQKHYRRGIVSLVEDVEGPTAWWHIRRRTMTTDSFREGIAPKKKKRKEQVEKKAKKSKINKLLWNVSDAVRLLLNAVRLKSMLGAVLWTVAVVVFTWWFSERWTSWKEGGDSCDPWWCTPFAVDVNVKEYVGFALFLLLGFRLYDSHWRYVEALRIWQEGIIGNTRLLTNRLFESYPEGTWHEGDLERIAGHVAAFAMVTVGGLRELSKRDELLQMLGPEDVRRIETADDAGTYCIDVVRAYLIDGDRLKHEGKHPCGSNIHWMLLHYITMLGDTASECERMIRIAVPYGYVMHLRIFMYVYLVMLPLGLVETSGWLTVIWVTVIAYGVLGVEHWADELANPFGFDVSDVPLDELCDEVIEVTRINLLMYEEGTASLVKEDRPAFPELFWEVGDGGNARNAIDRRPSDALDSEEGISLEV